MIEIIGKNGAGKSYLANKLYYLGFKRNVGYTTRPIRDGEIDGIDYFFITKEKFEEYIVNNDFDYSQLSDIDKIYIPFKYFVLREYSHTIKTICQKFNTYIYCISLFYRL